MEKVSTEVVQKVTMKVCGVHGLMNSSPPGEELGLPRPVLLNALYRALMRATRRRGLLTLGRWNARMFRKGELVRLPTGNELYVPGDPHFVGYVLGRHDEHVAEVMRRRIRSGALCVDAGANIGYFSVMMASLCGPIGRVMAFEPEAENFRVLELNSRLAAKAGLSISTIRAAASDVDGWVKLVRGAASTMHWVERSDGAEEDAGGVKCVRLDQAVAEDGVEISFLKVDVEGHELAVLKGCAGLFERGRVATAVVEVTPGATARGVGELMRRWNPEMRCWFEGRWRRCPVEELPVRGEVWMEFGG